MSDSSRDIIAGTDGSGSFSEYKAALVIGNSGYEDAPLRNPVNDAGDIAQVLQVLGFEVDLQLNADQQGMLEAIDDFGRKLRRGGVGLFYFAGHGMQVKGSNYLIPVNARIFKELHVRFAAINVGQILQEMEEARNRVNIVILDACRNNPYERRFRSGLSRGLASIDAPRGTLIAYSTAPGMVAEDGSEANSPYTSELVKQVQREGLGIMDVFMEVRKAVMEKTRDRQIPWESTSLTSNFYFRPAAAASVRLEEERERQQKRKAEQRKAEEELRRQVEQEEKRRIEKEQRQAAEEQQRKAEEERKRSDREKEARKAVPGKPAKLIRLWKDLTRYQQILAVVILIAVLASSGIAFYSNYFGFDSDSSSTWLTSEAVNQMIKEKGYYDKNKNDTGKGIQHQYTVKTISGAKVVTDGATSLMWQQAGSSDYLTYDQAKAYIDQLNRDKLAGFDDWRLPTLAEAMSLMEPEKKDNNLYIDPVFDPKQVWIWTSDQSRASAAWYVHFLYGFCNSYVVGYYYVRAVRFGQPSR